MRRQGYALVDFGEPTDLLVVNTCSVTEEAERNCRYAIRKTLKHSPDAFVAVTGCYAQTGLQSLRSIPGIDLIVGNQFKSDLPSFLPPLQTCGNNQRRKCFTPRPSTETTSSFQSSARPHSTRALVNPGWLQCDVQFLPHSVCPRPRAIARSMTSFRKPPHWRPLAITSSFSQV